MFILKIKKKIKHLLFIKVSKIYFIYYLAFSCNFVFEIIVMMDFEGFLILFLILIR